MQPLMCVHEENVLTNSSSLNFIKSSLLSFGKIEGKQRDNAVLVDSSPIIKLPTWTGTRVSKLPQNMVTIALYKEVLIPLH